MDIYLIIVVVLIVLAISGLVVGVSNDAVNFLNSDGFVEMMQAVRSDDNQQFQTRVSKSNHFASKKLPHFPE